MLKKLLLPMALGVLVAPHANALERDANTGTDAGPTLSEAFQPALDRETLGRIMLETWESRFDGDARAMNQFQDSLAAADLANLEHAATMIDFDRAMAALGGARFAPENVIPAFLSNDSDLIYVPIAPCRVLDTRVPSANSGRIDANSSRDFWGWGVDFASEQGGAAGGCDIEPNPAAIAMNVTAVSPIGAGYLTVYPFGEGAPLAATLNYQSGDVVGNESIVKVHQVPGQKEFSIYSFRSVHVVADAVGYFIRPPATALECMTAQVGPISVGAGMRETQAVSCPVGYTVVSGGADTPNNTGMYTNAISLPGSSIAPANGVRISIENTNAAARDVQFYARCCRTPGR